MKHLYWMVFAILMPFSSLNAQDGTLDNTFGTNGTVLLDNGGANAEILDIMLADNAITGVGFSTVNSTQTITIVQLDLDGNLNSSFGTNGLLTLPLGTGNGRASCIVAQTDGKYLVGGWARFSNKEQYVVARINQNGTLDTSFGDLGVATGSFSNSSFAEDEIADIELLSDGKIVVVGRGYNGSNEDAFIACLNTDGTLNTNFGTNGLVILDFSNSPPFEQANALAIDGSDNIFVGGRVSLNFSDEDSFFLTKLNSAGFLDNSFANAGTAIYTIAPNVIAGLNTLAIDNQGRILTGGGAFDTNDLDNNFFLTRYNSNGTLDNTFGTGGEVIIPRIDNEAIFDLEILGNGDIIAAGSTGGFPSRFALVRLTSDGGQDLNFGTNGWATTQIQFGFNSIRGMAVSGNRIYAGGTSHDGDTWSMAFAKYQNENMATSTTERKFQAIAVEVFPNPVVDQFNLGFELEETTTLSIQLLDVRGAMIMQYLPPTELRAGKQQYTFQLPTNLSKGSYFVALVGRKDIMAKALIK